MILIFFFFCILGRASLSPMEISFITLIVLLGCILGVAVIIMLLVLGSWCSLDKQWRKLVKSWVHVKWGKLFSEYCKCCSAKEQDQPQQDQPQQQGQGPRVGGDSGEEVIPKVSNNGFTSATAKKYMEALRETFKFAENDTILKILLAREFKRVPNTEQQSSQRPPQRNGDIPLQDYLSPQPVNDEQKAGD